MLMRRGVRALMLAFALAAFTPSVAHAALPNAEPQVLRTIGFEATSPGFDAVSLQLPTPATWGRTPGASFTGSWGMWCAGTDVSSGLASVLGTYPASTNARATLSLPELADYYSAEIGYWYVMPSKGSADLFQCAVARTDGAGSPLLPSVVNDSDIPETDVWARRTYALGAAPYQALSRQPAKLVFAFVDDYESISVDQLGRGPVIDDLTVTGFKFGPVRQLEATWSAVASGTELTWAAPAASATAASPDTRSIRYRAWRSTAGADEWAEVTPPQGVAEASLVDTGVAGASLLDYVVQAWDPEGVSYGVQSLKVRVATPVAVATIGEDHAPPVTTAVAPSGWVAAPASVTLEATDALSGVDTILYSTDGTVPTREYSGPIGIGTHGVTVVSYRAMDRFGNLEDVRTVDVNVDARAPITVASVAATTGAATVSLSVTDDGVGTIAGTEYRVDGGAVTSGTVVALDSAGAHVVEYRSRDMVGNSEEWKSLDVDIAHACTLALESRSTTVTYPSQVSVRGVLRDSDDATVTGATVFAELSYDGVSWTRFATATPAAGRHELVVSPVRTTAYRLVFPEESADALHLPATSEAVTVTVNVSMSTPSVKSSTVYRYRTFTVSANIRPKHSAGVKYRFFLKSGSKWVLKKTVSARYATVNSTTTRIYCSTSLPTRGTWRVAAYHAADVHPARYSPYRYLNVR